MVNDGLDCLLLVSVLDFGEDSAQVAEVSLGLLEVLATLVELGNLIQGVLQLGGDLVGLHLKDLIKLYLVGILLF